MPRPPADAPSPSGRRSRPGGRLVISGPSAAAGTITLADARATGTLGGRSFSRVRLTGPLTR